MLYIIIIDIRLLCLYFYYEKETSTMIYSYIKSTSTVIESTKEEEIISVVWNEYCNYKHMLENCTDESARPILEAQTEVLYEVSIKDIIQKVVDIFNNFIDWIRKTVKMIKDKINKLLQRKRDIMKIINQKIMSESDVVNESDNDTNDSLRDAVREYEWKVDGSTYKTTNISSEILKIMQKINTSTEDLYHKVDSVYKKDIVTKEDADEILSSLDKMLDTNESEEKSVIDNINNIKYEPKDYEGEITKEVLKNRMRELESESKYLDEYISECEDDINIESNVESMKKNFIAYMIREQDNKIDADTLDYFKFKLSSRITRWVNRLQHNKNIYLALSNKYLNAQNIIITNKIKIAKYLKTY